MKLKKALSLFMMGVMLSSSMPFNVFAEEVTTDGTIISEDVTASGSALTVLSDDIDVEFNVTGQWDGGFNGEIIITNVSDKLIENWQIEMQFPQEITNIWNASILSHDDDVYIIKNAGGNNNINIPVGESVSFGFGGTYENEIIEPSNIELVLFPESAKKKNYDIEYQVMSDWGSGYTAQITITNNTNAAMEGWHLNFDYSRKIESIWNAVIESNEDVHYDVSNAGYNSVIPAKGSISFGFTGNGGNIGDEPQNYELILNSTTDEVLAPEIVVDENSLGNYRTVADNYIISDEITSVSGELKNKKSFKEFYYIISSRSGEEIERKNIDINSEWTIEDIDLKNKTLAVMGITKDDTVILKMVVYIDPEYDYKDNDDDGLVNIFEDCYNTDKENEDSDGDGIPDGYEVWCSNTSAILYDTDDNGISDADEDSDKDGLTNLEEYNRSTSPLSADTDGDTLGDGDEVYKYGTDPLNADTDGDTLNDNDELKLSFDPLDKDTDDNGINDNDEVIKQTFVQKIDNDERKAVTSVSVTLACKGNIENSVTVEDMYNKDILSSGVVGLVGVPVEIQCDQTFDTAEIKFTYDESQLGETSEDDLVVMWYDEANNKYVLLDESVIDKENNTASYITTHFSTYLLVDKKIWLDAWRRDTPTTPIETYYDIAFVLDVSGSMNGTRIDKAKTAICTFINALSDKDRGAIISFNYNSYLETGLTYDRNILLNAAENAAEKTSLNGATNTDKGLYTGLTELKNNKIDSNRKQIAIMICDGDVNYVQSTIDIAKNNNIPIYTVNVVNSSNGLLEKIASETNGAYYYAATSNELGTILGDIQNTIVSDDSDGDGLKDSWETGGMQIPNGLRVYSNPKDPDTDNDLLNDGAEMGPYDEVNDYFPEYHSNPQDPDTDDDLLNDNVDPAPRYPFDTRFKIVDSFDYMPKIDFVERHIERGNKCYITNPPSLPYNTCPYLELIALADLGECSNSLPILANIVDQVNTLYPTKNFSKFLDHYIDNTGSTYYINSKDMEQIIFSQNRNIEHLGNNIYSMQQAAEELCSNNKTIYISTAGTNDFKATCYKMEACSHAISLDKPYDNVIALDWGYSVGESLCGMVAEVSNKDNCYYMNLKYYLIDTYEFPVHWTKEDEASDMDNDAHDLHEQGLAREYKIIGEYNQTISWKKGTLIKPKPSVTVRSDEYNKKPIS